MQSNMTNTCVGFGTGDESGDKPTLIRRVHVLLELERIKNAKDGPQRRERVQSYFKIRGEDLQGDVKVCYLHCTCVILYACLFACV